jgi:hypothetical protein
MNKEDDEALRAMFTAIALYRLAPGDGWLAPQYERSELERTVALTATRIADFAVQELNRITKQGSP